MMSHVSEGTPAVRSGQDYDHEICFLGVQRSGNHAFINWLLSLFPVPDVAFHNNISFHGDPRRCLVALPNRPRWAGSGIPSVLAYSFENKPVQAALRHLPRRWFPPKQRFTLVLLLRDPFNLFASLFQQAIGTRLREQNGTLSDHQRQEPLHRMHVERYCHAWKNHARTFLGDLVIAPGEGVPAYSLLPVSYNAWFAFEWYRKRIAAYFQVPYSETALHAIPSQGRGSSFTCREYQGKAREMALLERWPIWVENALYREMFDAPLVALSRRIFGRMEAAETALGWAAKL